MALQEQKKAKSPYQRYQKVPYRYSGAYGEWNRAIRAGNTRAAELAARDHAKQFGYVRPIDEARANARRR